MNDLPYSKVLKSVIAPGSVLLFGNYPQDREGNSNSPIEWFVLSTKGTKALIITQKGIDCRPYNDRYDEKTWETCDLRLWLNTVFYDEAFSGEEKSAIIESKIKAHKNQQYATPPGNETRDRVFILSVREREKYFYSRWDSECQPTPYAEKNGCKKDVYGNCSWWMRTPGYSSVYAACTDRYMGRFVEECIAIRPCCWIDLESKAAGLADLLNDECFCDDTEIEKGDHIAFGNWIQRKNTEQTAPMEWKVLEIRDRTALIISEFAIEHIPYDSKNKFSSSWEKSSLRRWLNETFYNLAFTDAERAVILSADTTLSSPGGQIYYQNNTTTDHVFALSEQEAAMYFASDKERACKPTQKLRGTPGVTQDERRISWWLRTPNNIIGGAYIVKPLGDLKGSVNAKKFGCVKADSTYPAVRPACWIALDNK